MAEYPGNKIYSGFLRSVINFSWWWGVGMGIVGILFFLVVGVCAAWNVPFLSEATMRDIFLGWKGYRLDLLTHPFRPFGYLALSGVVAFMYGCILFFIFQLRQVLRSMDGHTPFTQDNANRIRRMAYSVFVAVLLQMPPIFWALNYLLFRKPGISIRIEPSLDITGPLVFGLTLLALAEVFHYGVSLQGDQDLTI